MQQISFDDIKAAITRPSHVSTGDKLKVSPEPVPFVAPMFDRVNDQDGHLREIVLIRASAAVGKTTIARALSAALQVPILDLAVTAVATGSLKGLLGELRNGANPIDAFHAGELPLIVDALDEGRLRSGENGFVSFLETSAETLLESRSVRDSPKLILLGRPEAIDWAEAAFSEGDIELSILDVGYFDQEGARALIHAYANQAAEPDSGYRIHTGPVEQLITTYFEKIESALGLVQGELWASDTGRSFAGYAPVLAAIGSLLPEIDNFADALNRLNATGAQDAWSVIETVLREIIARDRRKLAALVQDRISKPLPQEAYDEEEQLALLLQLVQDQALNGTGRVQLPPSDLAKYEDEVSRWLPEHPFLRNGHFSNDVIASFVFADAIIADRPIGRPDRLASLSRQPFLWRSLSSRLAVDILLDGKYLGHVLNSFWSDPLTRSDTIAITSNTDGSVRVSMQSAMTSVDFTVAAPITLLGELKNADVRIGEPLILEGAGSDASSKSFSLDNVTIRSTETLTIDAAKVRVAGQVWLEGEVIASGGQLSLDVAQGAFYGWGPAIRDKYPFSRHPATLDEPDRHDDGVLESLLNECAHRFAAGSPLALNPDYTAPDRDPHTQWAKRRFPQEFPLLIDLLIKHGFAESEAMQASGTGKVRVRVNESFDAIKNGVVSNEDKFSALARDLREAIEQ